MADEGSRLGDPDHGYAEFTFTNKTKVISLAPLTGTVCDALDALDAMKKRAPGFMARALGVHVLPNGRARLLMESFDTRNRWNKLCLGSYQPSERVLGRLEQVLNPEWYAKADQGPDPLDAKLPRWSFNFSRLFEHDYLFISPDDGVRMGLPVRVREFLEIIPKYFRESVPVEEPSGSTPVEIFRGRLLDAHVEQFYGWVLNHVDAVEDPDGVAAESVQELAAFFRQTVARFLEGKIDGASASVLSAVHEEAVALRDDRPVAVKNAKAFYERMASLLGLPLPEPPELESV